MRRIRTGDGSYTFFSERYKQCFHSESGAVLEARLRYARDCRVSECASRGEVRILDIGFGLGYNVAAAIEAAGGLCTSCRIKCVSIENDEDVISFTQDNDGPEELKQTYPAIKILAKFGRFTSGRVDLRLVKGCAENAIHELPLEEKFDAVFLDPFTPDVNAELWTESFFMAIGARMAACGILSTYSSATRVKIALLRAGFTIGKAPKVGDKGSGTLASFGAKLEPFPEKEMKKLTRRAAEH